MCLITFAFQSHPDYPLVVAANRDEFFHRPTNSANFWDDAPNILAGRDLQAGGTWLGINKQGHFAAVTNVRDGDNLTPYTASRGELPTQHLLNPKSIKHTIENIRQQSSHYNGFNLLLGNASQLGYVSNHCETFTTSLAPGIYGLSNATLETPWPKVTGAKKELSIIMRKDWNNLAERQQELLALLRNTDQAAEEELPDTGIERDKERLLSSRFITSPEYGTRASTLVLFHRCGRIHFIERSYDCHQIHTTKEYLVHCRA